MLEEFFDDIEEIKKKFIDYLKTGKSFYASEDDLENLIKYFFWNNKRSLENKAINFALKLYPNSAIFYVKKGVQLFLSRKYEDSIKYLKKAYLYDLDNIEAITYLFLSYARLKDFKTAKTFLKKFESLIKEESEIILFYADDIFYTVFNDRTEFNSLFLNKRLSKVKKFIIEELYKLYNLIDKIVYKGTYELCYERMAFCLLATRNYDKADKLLKKAIEINPYSIDSWMYLSIIELTKENYQDALKYIEYAVAIDPDSQEPNLILASLLLELKRYKEAIHLLEPLSQKEYENESEILNLLAECYEAIGDKNVAIYYLEKSLEADNENVDSLIDIISIYLDRNDLIKAYKYIIKLRKIDKKNPELMYLNAKYLLKKGDYDLGLKYINRAISLEPYEFDYILLKSELLEAKGEIAQSILFLKSYIDDFEENSLFLYKIAGMYVSNKEISKAKKYLKIAVEKDSLYITDFLEHYPEAKHYNELKPLLNLT